MKSAAVKAQNLVYRWAEPFEPNDKPGEQVHRAWRRLRARQMKAGWSKVRRAYYGEAGEPTYLALKEQAQKVRALERNTTEPCGNDKDYLHRLRTMQRNAFGADAAALEQAIKRFEAL